MLPEVVEALVLCGVDAARRWTGAQAGAGTILFNREAQKEIEWNVDAPTGRLGGSQLNTK